MFLNVLSPLQLGKPDGHRPAWRGIEFPCWRTTRDRPWWHIPRDRICPSARPFPDDAKANRPISLPRARPAKGSPPLEERSCGFPPAAADSACSQEGSCEDCGPAPGLDSGAGTTRFPLRPTPPPPPAAPKEDRLAGGDSDEARVCAARSQRHSRRWLSLSRAPRQDHRPRTARSLPVWLREAVLPTLPQKA